MRGQKSTSVRSWLQNESRPDAAERLSCRQSIGSYDMMWLAMAKVMSLIKAAARDCQLASIPGVL